MSDTPPLHPTPPTVSPESGQAPAHIEAHPEVAPAQPPPEPHAEPLSAAATIAPTPDYTPEPPVKTDAEIEAEERQKEEADAAAKAEADKAYRAENVLTGSPNGDPAGIAFGPRIERARFEHRNQGHDDTMQLLDDMLAAIQRLEAKAADGAPPPGA